MKITLTNSKKWALRAARGFSLPEVTMAMGIATLGLTSILGLLPQGINNLRKAGEVTAAARISQEILGSLNQENWTGTDTKRRFYYDAFAVPVNLARQSKDDVVYVAEVSIDQATVSLPGADADPFLKKVVMKMKQTPYADFDFDAANPSNYGLYSYVLTDTGR